MTIFISHTTIDSHDAYTLSRWWQEVLGIQIADDPNLPEDDECMIVDPQSGHG